MAQFISTFITGFQEVVKNDLEKRFPKIKIFSVFDGLIYYQYDGNSHDLDNIIYFNNTFFVLKTMKGKGLNFQSLVGAVASEKKYYLINKGTFRVRFIQENQFAKVDKNLTKRAEEIVLSNSKLKIDRVSPSTEIWYSIRSEGFAFCGQLISKREFTEKNLNKGELRPELAYLICSFAQTDPEDVILEPFCGYGSIPVQLAKKFKFKKLYASDIDEEKIKLNSQRKQFNNPQIELTVKNVFDLSMEDNSVNKVITDPPWGFYEDIGDIEVFYKKMFKSFNKILAHDGKMIILTARTEEFKKIAIEEGVEIQDSLHTLVNGKKASLFRCKFI